MLYSNYTLSTLFLIGIIFRVWKTRQAQTRRQGGRNRSRNLPVATAVECVELNSSAVDFESPNEIESNRCDEPPKTCDGLPLPEEWEQRYTNDGEIYFYNQITRNRTFEDPRKAQFIEMHKNFSRRSELSSQSSAPVVIAEAAPINNQTDDDSLIEDSSSSGYINGSNARVALGAIIGYLFRPFGPIVRLFLPHEVSVGVMVGSLIGRGGYSGIRGGRRGNRMRRRGFV